MDAEYFSKVCKIDSKIVWEILCDHGFIENNDTLRNAFFAGWQRTWKSWGISSGIVSTLERSDDQRRIYARGHKDDEKNKMALDALNKKLAELLTDEICENL